MSINEYHLRCPFRANQSISPRKIQCHQELYQWGSDQLVALYLEGITESGIGDGAAQNKAQ
jgi:hypothetical protein